VKVANFVVQHNLPLAVADHLSPLLRDIFPDSEAARKYASTRTKTTCIVNHSLVPHFQSLVVDAMKSQPFTIYIDGSNDSDRQDESDDHPLLQHRPRSCCYTLFGYVYYHR
jgi:hypothetical protein